MRAAVMYVGVLALLLVLTWLVVRAAGTPWALVVAGVAVAAAIALTRRSP